MQFTVWAGTKIRFTAIPSSGYQFIGWTGSHLEPQENPQTVEVGSGRTITATFTAELVVPEYNYGALIPIAACLAAFITHKKKSLQQTN